MKLKKLEIIGFKSFLEKASITFPPGISAVVGPNGCGKSNIVDALRWVMGEQSVKQLRGKSKEDIIFAGANGKAPTNMAEVSITLLNDNGDAPEAFKDYSEVQVTRRLYRSGESAYLINRQPCRLKDIHNVFIGSGMGARTYSVIGQGNIGAITDAGPDERRVFLEEAAGVTRYKARKAETFSKIKSTNQNLLRVNDIVTEVERQMEGLKRQARKAERYKNYQTQIKIFDSHLLCHYYDEMTDKINRTEVKLRQLQDEDLSHSNRIKTLDASVAETKLKRWEKDQEISSQKSRKFELQRRADRTETELAHFKTDIQRFDEEIIDLEDDREELEIKNQRIETDVTQVTDKIGRLEEEIVSITTQLEKETRDSSDLQKELTQLNNDLDTCKTKLMQLVGEEARYRNGLQTTTQSKEGVVRRLRRMDEDIVAATQKKGQLEKKVVDSQAELTRIKEDIRDYNQRITNLQNQLNEKKELMARQVKIAQALEHKRNKSRSKLSALKKMADNYDWYKDGVKAIMRAWKNQQKTLDESSLMSSPKTSLSSEQPVLSADIMGLVADVFEAEEAYQIAVDAVMGEALQYVIVKRLEDGKAAIQFLESTQAGRSGFVPLEDLFAHEPVQSNHIETEKQLLTYVNVKPGYEAVGKALLGNVMVVDTIEDALDMAKATSFDSMMVTLKGELITPSGVLVGGSQDKLSGILAKKQELKKLQTQVATHDQELESAVKQQSKLKAEINTKKEEIQKLNAYKAETVQDETDMEKEHYRLTEDLKHAKKHLSMVQLEQEELSSEESRLAMELERQNKMLAAVTEKIQTVKANITQTSQKITSMSEKLNAFNQYTVDLKLKQTTMQADLENSRNTLKRLKEFHRDGTLRFEQLQREVAQKRERQEELKKKQVHDKSLLGEVYKEMEALAQELGASEKDFQALDSVLKENDKQIAKIQKERDEIRKKIRLLELELSEKRVKLENIEGRCEEYYHIKIMALRRTIADNTEQNKKIAAMQVSQMEAELARFKARLASIGDVNMGAIEEYRLLKERYDFLTEQRDDLITAIEDLHKVIRKINKITQERFMGTFNAVNDKLKEVFPKLFEGGAAWLELTDPKNLLESGVEYMVQPEGKKLTRMSLLSGGEKALSAIAFIFSIFLLRPASFCLMDEIDAPLDDANVFRFNQLLRIIGQSAQVVMITHNKRSMEFADTLFGITMEQRGISKVVSVNLQNT